MRNLRNVIAAVIFAVSAFAPAELLAAATLLPPGMQCFQATTGINGMVGTLGTITGGTGGTAGTYGGVSLTGGSGSSATANITVAGGAVTAVTILNPGSQYVVGDVLSAASGSIGGTSGFSVPVASVAINSSLAAGTVGMYVPNTLTFKQTWFDADQAVTHQNTNPITLDANGCAVIYGTGSYRQILKDNLGNTVFDKVTTDTSSFNSTFWASVAGGTPNVITVTYPGFNATDGTIINFIALNTNTGATTINPSGFGAIPVRKISSAGPVVLVGGDIVAGNIISVIYSSATNSFQLLTIAPAAATTLVSAPQGYLTLSSDISEPISSGDIVGSTIVYYTPFTGNQVPIYNGASYTLYTFPQLTLALTASQLANTIYDVCIFSNAGSPTIVTTPAWTNSAAGAGTRGTGAGTTQLQRIQGFWVNAVAITAFNGVSSFSVPVNQCTYLGSIFIDGSAGQVSTLRGYGGTRKWGVWNAYNRQPIVLLGGDNTASWIYNVATIRQSNGSANNTVATFTGLPEEIVSIEFTQYKEIGTSLDANYNDQTFHGIGINSTTVFSNTVAASRFGTNDLAAPGISFSGQATMSRAQLQIGIGVNNINMLEQGATTAGVTHIFYGTETNMVLKARWNG